MAYITTFFFRDRSRFFQFLTVITGIQLVTSDADSVPHGKWWTYHALDSSCFPASAAERLFCRVNTARHAAAPAQLQHQCWIHRYVRGLTPSWRCPTTCGWAAKDVLWRGWIWPPFAVFIYNWNAQLLEHTWFALYFVFIILSWQATDRTEKFCCKFSFYSAFSVLPQFINCELWV